VKDRSGHVLTYETIWHDVKLAASAVNKSGTLLSAKQTERLIRAITKKPPETLILTNCFDPHHAFVFYDANRKAVAWVQVCFHCGNIQAHPTAPGESHPDIKGLLKLSKQLKLPNLPR
jgi:hypothetical protein